MQQLRTARIAQLTDGSVVGHPAFTDPALAKLSATFTAQSLLKCLLTEGEKMILVRRIVCGASSSNVIHAAVDRDCVRSR
jgi:hypothetical protein